jgi:hypothetical protein
MIMGGIAGSSDGLSLIPEFLGEKAAQFAGEMVMSGIANVVGNSIVRYGNGEDVNPLTMGEDFLFGSLAGGVCKQIAPGVKAIKNTGYVHKLKSILENVKQGLKEELLGIGMTAISNEVYMPSSLAANSGTFEDKMALGYFDFPEIHPGGIARKYWIG